MESPSNPLLQVTDLRAVAALARAHDVLTMADNTFATPVNQRPADFGVDLVWHSATKYLNGHTDVSAGVLAGPAEILDRIWDVALLTGAVLGPFDAWLLLRGLRTLPLRVARHNANGQALAEALNGHPAVARVHYPGLATHPQHALAASQMSGFGGVLGLELADGFEAADAFLGRLRSRRSASLGGVESWPYTRRRCGAGCSARTRSPRQGFRWAWSGWPRAPRTRPTWSPTPSPRPVRRRAPDHPAIPESARGKALDNYAALTCVHAGRRVLHDALSRQPGCRRPRRHGRD